MASVRKRKTGFDLAGKWADASVFCMAFSLFFRMVYYFGLTAFADHGFLEIVFAMLLPLALCISYVVLMHYLKWNAPGTYGLIGAALCILLILWSFSTGSLIRIVVSAAWYAIAAGVLLFVVSGSFHARGLCVMMLGAPIVVRFVVFDIGRLSLSGWVLEASVLFMLAALMFLPMAMKRKKDDELSN